MQAFGGKFAQVELLWKCIAVMDRTTIWPLKCTVTIFSFHCVLFKQAHVCTVISLTHRDVGILARLTFVYEFAAA